MQKIFTKKTLKADHVHWQVEMRWVTPQAAAPSLSDTLQDDCGTFEGEGEQKKGKGHRASGGGVGGGGTGGGAGRGAAAEAGGVLKIGAEGSAGGEADARAEAEASTHTPRWEIVLKSTHGAVMDVMDEASLDQVLVFLSFCLFLLLFSPFVRESLCHTSFDTGTEDDSACECLFICVYGLLCASPSVCVCVCARARACVLCACVCKSTHACVCVCACVGVSKCHIRTTLCVCALYLHSTTKCNMICAGNVRVFMTSNSALLH